VFATPDYSTFSNNVLKNCLITIICKSQYDFRSGRTKDLLL